MIYFEVHLEPSMQNDLYTYINIHIKCHFDAMRQTGFSTRTALYAPIAPSYYILRNGYGRHQPPIKM